MASTPSPREGSRSGLRRRLVALALVPLVPLVALALLLAALERDRSTQDVQREARTLARFAAAAVDQRIEGGRQLLSSVALASGPGCSARLGVLLARATGIANLGVADRNGHVVCEASETGGGSVAAADWFVRALRSRGTALGDDPRGGVSPARAVVVARREGQGSVVFAAIELGSLETLTAGDALPEGASVIVLDSNGDVVTRAPASSHVPPGLAPLARRMEGTTQELTARGGERRLYSVQQIAGAGGGGLSVSVGLPHGTAYGAADRTVWRTLAAIALVALLALAAAVWVSERLVLRPLGGLLGATRRLATGERGVRSEVIAPRGELRELAESFDAMAAALDRRASEAERSMRERQRLLGELVTAEEDERNRLAVDIHDDSVQAISAALLRMEMLEARLEDPEHRRSLVVAIESVRAAITRLRHLVFELTPPAIARGGLAHALGLYLAQVGSSWGAEAELVDRLHDEPSPSLGGLVYRIAVEATGNAARHARASHITVALEQRDGGVHVVVTDDGIGFDVAAVLETPVPGHVGLRSMRDRAGSAGGSWHVDSEPGRGTILEFWIPDLGAGTPNGRD